MSKKLSFIFYLFIIIVTAGCTQSATSVFNKDEIYAQHLQYTKVRKIILKDDVIAIFNATYLNSVDSDTWDKNNQNFLVSLYNTKDDEKLNITMNGKKAITITNIDKKSYLYKNIAYKNHWSVYKIYTFETDDNKTLVLKAFNQSGHNTTITFEKE